VRVGVRSVNRDREWRLGLGAASLVAVAAVWQVAAVLVHSLLLPTFVTVSASSLIASVKSTRAVRSALTMTPFWMTVRKPRNSAVTL
jgi:hypothetical protein